MDILLTDVGLPGMSGTMLAEYAATRSPALAVVLVTGQAPDPAEWGSLSVPILMKPFSLDALLGVIGLVEGAEHQGWRTEDVVPRPTWPVEGLGFAGLHAAGAESSRHSAISALLWIYLLCVPTLRLTHFAAARESVTSAVPTDGIMTARPLPQLIRYTREGPVQVSHPQERLWLIGRLGLAGREAYAPPLRLHLRGKLEAAALSHAFVRVTARHESLRTRFRLRQGIPYQVIDTPGGISLTVRDVSHLGGAARASAIEEVYEQESRTRLDLALGPLFRATLLRAGVEEHVLLIKVHHIVFDGWSLSILLRELGALYTNFTHGARAACLPELPVQYADYAIWQREWLRGERLEAQVTYWQERLKGSVVLQLPLDRPRPQVASFAGGRRPVRCPAALCASLDDLARRERVTLYMLLLAAFQVVLFQWTGQTDIAVASPISGRTHRKTEGLIGFFLNMVVIRADLSGDPGFRALLAQLRQLTLDAYEHQDVTLERLITVLPIARPADCHPFAQAQLIFQNTPPAALDLPGMTTHLRLPQRRGARFDLTLELAQHPHALTGYLGYATDLFDEGTIDGLVSRFLAVLEAVVHDPQRRISTLKGLASVLRDSDAPRAR